MQRQPSVTEEAQVEKTTLTQGFAIFVYPTWKLKIKNRFMTFSFFPVFILRLKQKINQHPLERGQYVSGAQFSLLD